MCIYSANKLAAVGILIYDSHHHTYDARNIQITPYCHLWVSEEKRKRKEKKNCRHLRSANGLTVCVQSCNGSNRRSLMWSLATFGIRHNDYEIIPCISLLPIHITRWISLFAIARRVDDIAGHIRNRCERYTHRFITLESFSVSIAHSELSLSVSTKTHHSGQEKGVQRRKYIGLEERGGRWEGEKICLRYFRQKCQRYESTPPAQLSPAPNHKSTCGGRVCYMPT